jgi:DNA repair photolyase
MKTPDSGRAGSHGDRNSDEFAARRDLPRKGRGAVRNVPGRFQRRRIVPVDDGWGSLDEPATPLETVVTPESPRTILSRNDSPDIPFDRSINPYKGCEHGCVYCFARPSHSFLDLSPGLDFESRIFSKPTAPELLRHELSRRGYRCRAVALGANTDPYQPVEEELGITRGILEVLREFRHPVIVVTKSHRVLRDLDLLGAMARDGLAGVYLSITTLDRKLARRMEPRAPTPERRLQAIRALAEAGVPVGVLASPMIPGLNDSELDRILEAAAAAGARSANYILVRLPHEVKELFEDWLNTHYAGRADKILNRIREARGGELNDPRFGSRMKGAGKHAELLRRRFDLAIRRLGLNERRWKPDCSKFRVPAAPGSQRGLFD